MSKILLAILILAVLIIGWPILRSYLLFQKTLALEAASQPFSRSVPDAPMKILVLGDSTAVGTGSDKPEDSTAGRLGALYPHADVTNLAVNGLRIAGLLDILGKMGANDHYDLVLIQIGANDIIRLTSMKDIDAGISQALDRARKFGGQVIVLHSGDIGQAGFFPWYVRPILSWRSREVRDIYIKQAAAHGATYVNIIDSEISKAIGADPGRYYADDRLHLSGDGYGLWFSIIKPLIKI